MNPVINPVINPIINPVINPIINPVINPYFKELIHTHYLPNEPIQHGEHFQVSPHLSTWFMNSPISCQL